MDDFLSPSEWNGTAVSKGDLIPNNERPSVRTTTPLPVGYVIPKKNARQKIVEKPDQKIAEDQEKKEKQALKKAKAKWAGESSLAAPKKTKKKAQRNVRLTGSESEGTIFAAPINHSIPKPLHTTVGSKQNEIKTSIVDLGEHNQEPTPPLLEMISHLAAPLEDDVLCSLTNYEVVRRTYQLKDMERERNERRQTTFDQVERIKKLDEDHVPKSKQLYDAENEARALEEKK
nr:hypothetical protein [Tanacetum cinerariifolium]